MRVAKSVFSKMGIFCALCVFVFVVMTKTGMITEQAPEAWQTITPEGVVVLNTFAEDEIQKLNGHFQEVQATWAGENSLLLCPSKPDVESRRIFKKTGHGLEDREKALDFAAIIHRNEESIDGLKSVTISNGFHLLLRKQKDRSWRNFTQDLVVVLERHKV